MVPFRAISILYHNKQYVPFEHFGQVGNFYHFHHPPTPYNILTIDTIFYNFKESMAASNPPDIIGAKAMEMVKHGSFILHFKRLFLICRVIIPCNYVIL